MGKWETQSPACAGPRGRHNQARLLTAHPNPRRSRSGPGSAPALGRAGPVWSRFQHASRRGATAIVGAAGNSASAAIPTALQSRRSVPGSVPPVQRFRDRAIRLTPHATPPRIRRLRRHRLRVRRQRPRPVRARVRRQRPRPVRARVRRQRPRPVRARVRRHRPRPVRARVRRHRPRPVRALSLIHISEPTRPY